MKNVPGKLSLSLARDTATTRIRRYAEWGKMITKFPLKEMLLFKLKKKNVGLIRVRNFGEKNALDETLPACPISCRFYLAEYLSSI